MPTWLSATNRTVCMKQARHRWSLSFHPAASTRAACMSLLLVDTSLPSLALQVAALTSAACAGYLTTAVMPLLD